MTAIHSVVSRAQKRLVLATFGRSMCYTISAAAIVSIVSILTQHVAGWQDSVLLDQRIPVLAFGFALTVSLFYTWLYRPSKVSAAQEVDRRFSLKERLCTVVMMDDRNPDDAMACALIAESEKVAKQVNLVTEFTLRPTVILCWPCSLLVLLFLCHFFGDVNALAGGKVSDSIQRSEKSPIQEVAKILKRQMSQRRKLAAEKGLIESEQLYSRLERKVDRILADNNPDPKQAMIAINDLKNQLEQRREELGDSESMKRVFSQVKGLQGGATQKLARSLSQGDFDKAAESIKEIARSMQSSNLTAEEKENLRRQLESMAASLNDAVKQIEEQKQELERQIAAAKASGSQDELEKLQDQLADFNARNAPSESLRSMASMLNGVNESVASDRLQDASSDLQEIASQLEQMQKDASELEDLDRTLDQISRSKNAMRCNSCGGAGCSTCNGAAGNSQAGQLSSSVGQGNGLGEGTGFGDRPEAETDTNTYQSKVRAQIGKGKVVISGPADGPNRKGVSREALKQAIEASLKEQGSPSSTQVLPRAEREHAMQYFDQLREGS
ncbi:MAG: hypothetical protein L7U72_00335 [Rubripirellula sp.]|nr:hypothetical protein [Rubripirellula sp.]